MTAMTHPVAPEEVMAWLDGELSRAEAEAIQEHVRQCADCAELAEHFRATSRALAQWSVEEAPAILDAAEANHSRTYATRSEKIPPYTRLSFLNWRLWAIGAGGVAVGVLALIMFVASGRHVTYRMTRPMESMATNETYLSPPPAAAPSPPAQGIAGGVMSDRALYGEVQNGALSQESKKARGMDANGLFRSQSGAAAVSSFAPMIARTVSLTVLVKDFAASRLALDKILTQIHGYPASLTVNTPEGGGRSLQASLRIPADDLASAIGGLRSLGHVLAETQSGEEVTQQHADLVARLQNSREEETRLRAILEQRTGKIEDVLQVEEAIARVRGEIESMEAEQKTLEHRVDFATVDLQLTEEYKEALNPSAESASTRLSNAFIAGLRNASATVLGIVLFLEEFGPAILVWLVILGVPSLFVWRRYRRAHRAT